jgi:hypothetical protein
MPGITYIKEVALGQTVNLVASQTVISQFVRNNDARQFVLFVPLTGADTITYLAQGSFAQNTNFVASTPSPLVAGNPQDPNSALAPVILISAAECNFLQAEAVSRGWGDGVCFGAVYSRDQRELCDGWHSRFRCQLSAECAGRPVPCGCFGSTPGDHYAEVLRDVRLAGFRSLDGMETHGVPDVFCAIGCERWTVVPATVPLSAVGVDRESELSRHGARDDAGVVGWAIIMDDKKFVEPRGKAFLRGSTS